MAGPVRSEPICLVDRTTKVTKGHKRYTLRFFVSFVTFVVQLYTKQPRTETYLYLCERFGAWTGGHLRNTNIPLFFQLFQRDVSGFFRKMCALFKFFQISVH
jgi:hypothetical protein